jgi:hypothetical protein
VASQIVDLPDRPGDVVALHACSRRADAAIEGEASIRADGMLVANLRLADLEVKARHGRVLPIGDLPGGGDLRLGVVGVLGEALLQELLHRPEGVITERPEDAVCVALHVVDGPADGIQHALDDGQLGD